MPRKRFAHEYLSFFVDSCTCAVTSRILGTFQQETIKTIRVLRRLLTPQSQPPPREGRVASIWETMIRRERPVINEVDYILDKNEVLLDTKPLLRKF